MSFIRRERVRQDIAAVVPEWRGRCLAHDPATMALCLKPLGHKYLCKIRSVVDDG